MIKYTLLAILLISTTVSAQDCTSKTNEADCTALSGCEYTSSGSTCTNSCTALSQTECTSATNSPNCTYASAATCTNTVDCTSLQAAGCSANNACTYTPASTGGTCAVKAALATYCGGLSSTDCQGTGSSKCNYAAGAFTCSYKTGVCTGLASADCASNFCTLQETVCTAQIICSDQSQQSDCDTTKGCSWDGVSSKCSDVCTSYTSDNTCTGATEGCKVTTPYSCSDNTTEGGNTCGAAKNSGACTTAATAKVFCTGNTAAGTCSAKNTYCTSKSDNTCDATLCTFSPTTADSCANAYDCAPLQASNTCGSKSGCTSNTAGCKNKTASSCNTSDNQATCTGTGKFCTFAQTGTCSVSATSYGSVLSSAATVGSLIAALTFL